MIKGTRNVGWVWAPQPRKGIQQRSENHKKSCFHLSWSKGWGHQRKLASSEQTKRAIFVPSLSLCHGTPQQRNCACLELRRAHKIKKKNPDFSSGEPACGSCYQQTRRVWVTRSLIYKPGNTSTMFLYKLWNISPGGSGEIFQRIPTAVLPQVSRNTSVPESGSCAWGTPGVTLQHCCRAFTPR